MIEPEKKPLKILIQIDTNEEGWEKEFSRLIKALLTGGYKDQVKELAQQILAEAKRRNLPIREEDGLVISPNQIVSPGVVLAGFFIGHE